MESNGDQLTDLPTPGQCTIADDLSPSPGDSQPLRDLLTDANEDYDEQLDLLTPGQRYQDLLISTSDG